MSNYKEENEGGGNMFSAYDDVYLKRDYKTSKSAPYQGIIGIYYKFYKLKKYILINYPLKENRKKITELKPNDKIIFKTMEYEGEPHGTWTKIDQPIEVTFLELGTEDRQNFFKFNYSGNEIKIYLNGYKSYSYEPDTRSTQTDKNGIKNQYRGSLDDLYVNVVPSEPTSAAESPSETSTETLTDPSSTAGGRRRKYKKSQKKSKKMKAGKKSQKKSKKFTKKINKYRK